MSHDAADEMADWLKERRVGEVECLVAYMAGIARGKILPTNWTYRLHVPLEELARHEPLKKAIKAILK